MGATEGETAVADSRPSEEPESAPAQETLQVPTQKRRKLKSPTPLSLRGRSATPVHGRSQTPFTLYMTRRSATPSSWRSITPFLKREEREKTPFELGKDIRTLITCNTAVFDRALIMDITEPEDIQKPVRYITSDVSVIDRAAVMDVSNVEVIYVVEEYEEYEEEEELIEEVKPKKKSKGRKGKTPRKSAEKEQSPSRAGSLEQDFENDLDIEDGLERDEREETPKKGKKKAAPKKKEKKEKSPSPQLTLKLELGGGSKANKKMFEQQEQKMPAGPKPPPKKSKLVLQIEEQARAAAKAAEEEAAKLASKQKSETFEERQKRLQKEKEEKERLEAELRAAEAEAQAEAEAEARAEAELEDEEGESGGEEGEDGEDGEFTGEEGDGASRYDEDADENGSHNADNENDDVEEEADEVPELPKGNEKRRGSEDEYTKFEDDECWKRIAEEEGEEFMQQLRKYSIAQRRSEKERDADWQRKREQARHPHFIAFLTDRTVQTGQNVRLACAVGGPELSVKWFKDGRQIERDATHRIVNNNNILILEILNTTILDSGEYACVISNLNDEVTSSCYVTIYEIFKDEPQSPSFRLIRDYYHLRDDELTIEVHLHGVPRPIVSWWRDAFEIKPNFKFTMLEEAHGVYKLLIYKPTNRDSGAYICKALNSSGEAQTSHIVEVAKNRHFHVPGIFHGRNRILQEKEVAAKRAMEEALQSKAESDKKRALAAGDEPKVKGHYRASPEPLVSPKQKLRFATQLRDRMALEGTKVRFICTVIGPEPTCRWMKDDKWVVVGGNIKNLSEEGKAILELSKVTNESSGVYKCVAKNEHSEIETSCYFKVYSAQTDGDEQEPIFALPLRDVYHSSQNDLIIDTKVRGNPRPTISWLKDNIPVVSDERKVQIEHLDGLCELIINKPAPSDGGVYTCVAENKLGNQKITHTVVFDVVQTSRRSSALSNTMPEVENSGSSASRATKEGGDDENKKPPKPKRKDDAEAEVTYERRSRMPDPSPKQQLYFIANLSNRYIAEGSKVKLQAVIGGPDATIKWLKNDQNVAYGPRIRNMNRDNLAVLEILKALPEDSGTYSILAQNEFCKISTTALLHVYQPKVNSDVQPTFIRSLKDTYHLNTNELILETAVRGQPTPEVQWFKDSVEIARSEKYQILEHQDGTCELIIDKPENRDSGKYTVRAENREGKMEISHYVLFEGKEHHIADNIHGVFHADPSLLRSRITEVDKPAATGEEKAESDTDDGKGKRRSRKTKESDKEEEEVVAPSAEASNVKEKKREKVIGIHFATNMKDRVVAEGSKVKISCFLEAKEPQVKWFKNGEQIANSPKMRGRYSEGLCLLDIASATLADSGEYQCVAQDETGKASTSCKLEIYANPGTGDVPPTFTRNIKDTLNAKINELHLDVHVRGLPTPTISWIKDGVKIENSEKYQLIDHDDGTCELFISNPVNADNGKYVCQAENREGKSEITHMVTVEPRRTRPSSPQREARPPTKPPTDDGSGEKETKRKKPKDDEEEAESSRREVPPPPDLRKRLYFRNFLTNRTVQAGSNVKWVVNIDGPDPTARWFHGEQPIAFGPKSKLACQDGIAFLNLIGVKEEDAGEYTLKVKGAENEIISKCDLFVYSVGKEQLIAPVFTVGIKDVYSLNENELVLDCRIRGKPLPEIQWMKGSDLITNNEKYQQIDQADGYAKLIIRNPTERDSGLYSCVATNEAGESKLSHQVDFVGRERFTLQKTHGFFHRDPNKPHFVAPLGDQTVCPGGTAAISAEFLQTNSPIDVQWIRNRQILSGQPNIKTFMDRGVYTLAIQNATPEIEGTYTCRASNAFGRIESHVNVDVTVGAPKNERPPLFLSRPDTEMKIAVGDPFSVSFRISGDPKPKLTFMKGTKDITKSDRVVKEAMDDFIRFTVHKSQISDSGTYFVVARNNFGTDRVFVTVTVMPRARSETPTLQHYSQLYQSSSDVAYFRDPPGPVSSEPLAVDSGPSHISLSWGKSVSANSAPVVAYRVDAWMMGHEGGAVWKELGLTPINSFDAFNLKPHVKYHFRITPRNRYGWGPSVQTSSPLQVGGVESLPEFIKILPGQVKALLGSQFALECIVRGAPRPVIVWYKDSARLSSNSERIRIKQVGSNCTLLISQVCATDVGRYTCKATNSKGCVSTFARLQVVSDRKLFEADGKLKEIVRCEESSSKLGESLPIFTMRLRDRRVQVSYPVRLTCQVVSCPAPTVTWYKEDQELCSDRSCVISSDGQFYTLELISTSLEDSGVYSCTAKNEMGSVSCHCTLVVDKGIRAYIAPDFYTPLDPLYIFEEGQEIRLSAKVEAYPAIGVSWYRNGLKLRPSRKVLATLDSSGFVELIIADATQRDAGIYLCEASNAVGKAESTCQVSVKQAMEDKKEHKIPPAVWTTDLPYSKEPMFVVKPRSSEAYEGDTVIIFCEVVGDPKPEVVWLRDFLNPEYYKDAPHFRRVGEGPEYRLEIPSAKLDFTGSYSVIATNCHGEAKAVISLQIYAKDILKKGPMEKGSIRHGNIETLPYFVRHLRNLRCCDGDAITLECHVEAVPEPVIIWEKDGRVLCSGKEFITSYNGIKATLSISRVYPEDEGEYTCVAKNNIGRTLSSACIIVDQPEEKENMLHRQLARPMGLLSANSTPRSTPRSTPARSISPMRLSHRRSSADLHRIRRSSLDRGVSLNQAISAPKFYSIPHSRVVEEGDSVRFQCTISGNPMPWSTWDKDGRIVTPTTRISIKDVDDLRFLEIDEVTFDDAGLYRVTLENDYGRIETTARLDVIGSSRYSKSPSGRGIRSSSSKRKAYFYRRIMGPSTAIGGRMALAAGFRGSSVPSCNFYHNGVLLQESERVHIEIVNQQEVQLIVERVTKADEGVYTCVLETPEDDQLASSLIVCFHNPKEISSIRKGPRIIQELPLTQQSDEGETADLSFELECEEPYSYTWTKNGEVLPDSPEFNYIDHGNGVISLRIHGVYDVDSGQYSCIITTSDGSTCSTSGELNIIQCSRDSGIDNSDENVLFLKPPLPAITRFGGEATFCAKVHPRDVDVEWSVCGRKVEESAVDFRLESSKADGLRFLHIRNVDYSHSGEVLLSIISPDRKAPAVRAYSSLLVLPVPVYTSRYSPDQNFIYSSIPGSPNHLLCEQFEKELLVPAYILDGPADCTVLIGGSVTLSVRFEGLPQPDVKWFKAGRPIAKQRNISICTQNNCSTLSIDDIAADDSGKYTVEIMNELNAVTAAASVAVEGPPEPPSGRPSISQGPDRIAVAWCGPPYDGGCILTGFQIEMQQAPKARNNEGDDFSPKDEWLQIALVSDSLAYTVKNLSAENIYRFRVRAVNVHGCSAPGSVSDWVALKSPEVTTEDFQSKPICVESGGDFKSRFEILEELGKGRFGIVYKVLEKGDSAQILAAKVVKCIKARDRQKVQDEISIMRSLKHPKLLRLAAVFESPREIIMVMEYITGGELFERVVADDFTLTERDCILFLRQVCGGVAYMHSRSIVHLDLKPENIMCHTRTSHQIKIIDFGLAQRLNTNTPVRVLFGTPEFIPPEVINYEPIGFQSDMWSVGVICYVLLSGLSPFMGDTDAETFANITRADYDFEDEAFDSVSQEAKDFISNLLVHRKEKRWTAQECLESKWLTQGLDEHSNYNRICTDKLKKFIIRRKWQKTGNAIRALGRMATLSASRRNSLISTAGGSLPSSPRPSISGINIFSPNLSAHMSSLNEEEDDFNVELPSLDLNKMHIKAVLKTHIKSECNERSDSGFSESSSFSGFGISSNSCVHSSAPVAELEAINPPVADLDSEKAIQLSVLKTKLDQIATQSEQKEEAVELNAVVNDNNNDAETLKIDKFQTDAAEKSASEIANGLTVSPAADLNNESHATDTRSSPVSSPGASPGRQLSPIRKTLMRSDFTNTIQMRKKSLENNLSREKAKPTKSVFEQPGKVSRLKNKFNNFPGQQDDSMKPSPCKSVLSRLPCDRKTKLTAKLSSTSVPASPLPERSATPSRLSARVREATERLSSQHTVTSAKRAESRRALTHTKS